MTVGGTVSHPPGLEIVDIKQISRVPVLEGQSALNEAADLAPVHLHGVVEVVSEWRKEIDKVSIGPAWRLTCPLEVSGAVADVEDPDQGRVRGTGGEGEVTLASSGAHLEVAHLLVRGELGMNLTLQREHHLRPLDPLVKG